MIPFYVVSGLWLVTLGAWMASDRKHASERVELIKLFKAHNLADYTAQEKEMPKTSNYLKASIKRSYDADLLGDDDA